MKVYNYLQKKITELGAIYLILIDPDILSGDKLVEFVGLCQNSGVDGFLVGGSLVLEDNLKHDIELIKKHTNLPVIIFPGGINQVIPAADALLFISLISGRNSEHIIGKHVAAAPLIKKAGLEPISTGYMLIESGSVTTAEYMSESKPIPRNKPEIAAATALAAEYLGMKMIYLEAGSGAKLSVPNEMVKAVSSISSLPLIVGGGIRDAVSARQKVENGAKIIVTGNYFEDSQNWSKIKEFANAIHINKPLEI